MASNSSEPNPPVVSVRGQEGLYLLSPIESEYNKLAKFNNFHDESKNCRVNAFDPTGRYFAYCNNTKVNIIDLKNECKLITSIEKPRTSYLKFSPLGSYLIVWETFYVTKDEHKEVNNLNIYETQTGKLYKSTVQKKQLENFVEWSNDETIFGLLAGEILFFAKADPENPVNRLKIENIASFSMSPVSKCIAVHVSGKKNEPSFIRLYQYPDLKTPLANKSFFNTDKVEFKWNISGNNLLLLCSTETSKNSYYGDSTLHQINTKGESQLVTLSKSGPIYALDWNPSRDEFIVIYGSTAMPAKATLFDGKCQAIYDFGTGSRNELYFNHHGSVVCLAGFGNLRGQVEVWHLNTSNRVPVQLTTFQADDTTYFEWSPDSQHILTATTAPRLRVSNGFKIWNYWGEKLFAYAMPEKNELWQVQWQQGKYPQKPVVKKQVAAVKEETKAYVPPHLRGANKPTNFKSKLHEDDEKPDKNLKIKTSEISKFQETEKKIKAIKKKLSQIDELKKKQATGEKLEKNQLEKLESEKELLDELKKLNVS